LRIAGVSPLDGFVSSVSSPVLAPAWYRPPGWFILLIGGIMDTVEVTLHLDRSLAERLRDPGERARYEAFLQLVSNATSQADIREAARLLTATTSAG
jgi:hypothetical protein